MRKFAGFRLCLVLGLWIGGTSAAFAAEPIVENPVKAAEDSALYQSAALAGKTAYVDMARLFNHYPGTQKAIEILQKEMEQKKSVRQALTEELERLAKDGASEGLIKEQVQKIQLYDQETERLLDARQAEVFTPVFETLEAAVKKFGAKKAYQAIYAEPREGAADVTADILKSFKK